MSDKKKLKDEPIRIYTDGACSGNPGAGGWAVVIAYKDKVKLLSGNFEETTNNKMELVAMLKSLEYISEKGFSNVEVYSDSAYVVNAINENWIVKWKMNQWVNSKKEDVKNRNIWESIYWYLNVKFPKIGSSVRIMKVKGHNGNTLNEIADMRAKEEVLKAKAKKIEVE